MKPDSECLSVEGYLDRLCDEFERRWRSGETPRLEEFLARVDPSQHRQLLRELVAIELHWRRERREQPRLEEYCQRFPECRAWLLPEGATSGGDHDATVEGPEVTPRSPGQGEPQRFGDYDLLEEIGRGGMGIVYRAMQRSARRLVALKVIGRDRWDSLPAPRRREVQERFRNEAQAAARLQHDHLVTVYEVGEVDGQPFFSMQLVEGPSFAELVTRGPLSSRLAAESMEAVARAVHEAHTHGILHRDLKPQNILLDSRTNRPLVVDFGLAKVIEPAAAMTRTGDVVGTPSHMSPEQAQDSSHVTVQTDVYALGATLYHLLTARPPFQAATAVETLRQVISQEPVPPRRLNPAIEPDLDTICVKCLQKEPSRRYATALELADDLRRFREGRPIRARRAGFAYRTWRWTRRNPLPAAMGLVATICLLAAVGAGLVAYRQQLRTLTVEQESRARTDESFRDALETVRRLCTRVTEDPLLHQPGMQSLRRELLREAQQYYEKFLARRGGDPAVRAELAAAEFQIGRITEELQSPAAARPLYERARHLQRQLVAERPGDPARQSALAATANRLGRVLHQMRQFEESLAAYGEALQLRQQLAARFPLELEYPRGVASTTMNIGLVESDRENVAAAERHFEAAHRLQQELYQQHPDQNDLHRELAMSCFNRAHWELRRGNADLSRQWLVDAMRRFEQLVRREPALPEDGFRLALCCRMLADLEGESGQDERALASYARAEAILEPLVQANPGVVPFRAQLAALYLNRGQLQYEGNDRSGAAASLSRAAGILQPLVEQQPELADCRRELAAALHLAGQLDAAVGQHSSAHQKLTRALQHWQVLRGELPEEDNLAVRCAETEAALAALPAEK